jgi:hypothetical protein
VDNTSAGKVRLVDSKIAVVEVMAATGKIAAKARNNRKAGIERN